MKEIETILNNISQQENIKILYACETGSRAWGFPSPDSDYDVRFIYMHEKDWYLSLSQRKDTIEYMEGELDITGWNLKKCLTLLKKSNAPLIERFQSPVEYFGDVGFKENFTKLIKNYYSPTAVFFHHYSLANKFWDELKGKDEIKLKNLFYLVRSLLSCNWIIKDKSVLPMSIDGLMNYIADDKKAKLKSLIKLKATVGEKYLHPKEEEVFDWIKELFSYIESNKTDIGVNKTDMDLLNQFFLNMLNRNDHD
ncbi:MAG: nucleotidyltransferase domain-containing protein [Sphingobacteriales bacterium]|nr:nucleotidyltransferase domain-containing protein [Sphingobacteriales bacterium]